MKIKTQDLTGEALDWAVAKCENPEWPDEEVIINVTMFDDHDGTIYNYSTNWQLAGPIIEREGIYINCLRQPDYYRSAVWEAWPYASTKFIQQGPTPLVAAMRCYVASKLGEEIDINMGELL